MSGLFNIPEEVIWEMSQDDCIERNHEAYGANDWERGFPSVQDIIRVEELARTRFKPNMLQKCPLCGHGGLLWEDTKFGKRLVYGATRIPKLRGKIHGCA